MKAAIRKELILKVMKALAERGAVGQGLAFDIGGTDNSGFLKLDRGYAADKQVCLGTAVVRNGDDHLVQHFFHYEANMDEMKKWLLDPRNADGIIGSLTELSDRVDKGFD